MEQGRAGSRRIVGFALLGSAVIVGIMAAAVLSGTFGIAPQSRTIVAGAMGAAAVLDVLLAIYFIVSDPS